MHKFVKGILSLSFSASLILAGCSNDKFAQKANEQIEKNQKALDGQKASEQKIRDKASNIYKEMEKPLNEVVKDNELDKREEQVLEAIPMKDSYIDPNELALRIGKELFEFNSGISDADQYYEFLSKHASTTFKQKWIPNEKEGKLFLHNIQEVLKKQKTHAVKYLVTQVELNPASDEGNFYRKETLNTEEEIYYITTIVKEKGSWKLQDDSPSPPYEEIGGTENESTSTEN